MWKPGDIIYVRAGETFEEAQSRTILGDETIKEQSSPLQQRSEAGLRYDAAKFRYDLIPADALDSLAQVYTVGAKKYADRNWERGMSWGRCFGSLMRHAWAFWRGEDNDLETGLPHMAHVAWNAFALLSYSLRKIGTDDRVVK